MPERSESKVKQAVEAVADGAAQEAIEVALELAFRAIADAAECAVRVTADSACQVGGSFLDGL